MRSPIVALSWQYWFRHRLGLSLVLLCWLTFALLFQLLPQEWLQPPTAYLCTLLFVVALIYTVAVFTSGFECKLEGRESGFPARLFTLPVRTMVLVGWPMLQGVVVVTLLWATWSALVLQPGGMDLTWWARTLLPASGVVLLQTLVWSPVGVSWLRVIGAVVLLPLFVVVPQFSSFFGIDEETLVIAYAALIPLGFLGTWAGVAYARRGGVPDWLAPLRFPGYPHGRSVQETPVFASVARAQLWWECRQRLLLFPLLVAGGTLLFSALGFMPRRVQLLGEYWFGLQFLYYPLLLAPFVGFALCRTGTSAANPYPLSTVAATRPLTVTALVAAKLKLLGWTTLIAWLIVWAAAVFWWTYADAYAELADWWRSWFGHAPAWKMWGAALLVSVGLILLTWRLLADVLFLGLAGRPWVYLGGLAVYCLGAWLGMLGHSLVVGDPVHLASLRATVPWAVGGAIVLKLLAAAWVSWALLRRRLLTPVALTKSLALWALAVVVVVLLVWVLAPPLNRQQLDPKNVPGILLLITPYLPEDFFSIHWIICGAVLAVPLVRLAATPLALAWNRHR